MHKSCKNMIPGSSFPSMVPRVAASELPGRSLETHASRPLSHPQNQSHWERNPANCFYKLSYDAQI